MHRIRVERVAVSMVNYRMEQLSLTLSDLEGQFKYFKHFCMLRLGI